MLLIDLGNSSLKWALTTGKDLVRSGHWHHGEFTPRAGAERLMQAAGGVSVQRILMSAVARPATVTAVEQALRQVFGVTPEKLVSPPAACGLRNAYTEPAQLGADRWAAMVAAWRRAAGPVVVVDCGTAVTVDAVDGRGAMLGGAIFPGLQLLRDSLLEGTGSVRPRGEGEVELVTRSTDDAVAVGVQTGWQGAVMQLVQRYRQLLGVVAPVFLTGGDAARLGDVLPAPVECYPELVLEGLNIIARENASRADATGLLS